MFIHCELVILILVMTLDGQVHAGEIYGGHKAAPHSRPYMVLLELHLEDGSKGHCGGFLLNEDFVMTAAHCQAKSYTVLLGVHDVHKNDGIHHISVKDICPHEDYNVTDYQNDIMLLKLRSKAHLNEQVKPIPLAAGDDFSVPNSCTVSGWGRSNRNTNHMSPVLMEANVTLISDEQCAEENFYCSEGKTGPGQGDSGGPLVCEDRKAYGVVSTSGNPNSDGPIIYRYTKIPKYRKWIDFNMENCGKL
ncbi:granzyme E-like isoform X1 [Toxotes jaculatrix]|uniref:granzyme E-like isoform X1 n=1 Tax=Toxotes jaculatrix TaxID=941984 RepID=UPI001B3AFF22|nr:granzyme E-like isoform X1 [Toxotes jaculatrix]